MSKDAIIILSLVLCATLVTLAFVFILFRKVSKIKIDSEKIEDIAGYIHSGAIAFLKREFKIIIPFILVLAVILGCLGLIPALKNAEGVGFESAICLVVGATFSGAAGWIGMLTATKANARTAVEAKNKGMSSALKTAFSGGAILGLSVAGLGLLGLTALFFIFYAIPSFSIQEAAKVVTGYGLGCSMIALFARVG